jgi:SpoVK/Ycf46/Vps4 family AAA+-type ATPase
MSYLSKDSFLYGIFNADSISIDGEIVYSRIYAAAYPEVQYIEDARPDYFIQRTEFDQLLKEVYGTVGISIHKSYISGKCLDVRLLHDTRTMFFVTFVIGEDLADRNFRISSKDMVYAKELGLADDINTSLERTTEEEYNARQLAPFVKDEELVHALLRVFYYPIEHTEKAKIFSAKYDALKFERQPYKASTNNSIYTLVQNAQGLMLSKHFLNTDKYKSEIIESNYNDNFAETYEKIIKFLKSDCNGLILLTGEPGTGKSSLLMHLTSICQELDTKFVFIPSSLASVLSDPSFLPFAISALNDSVLILEDAEDILKDRSLKSTEAVSNILNITDGILGKIVKVKLIATVNKEHTIDKAVTRSGRLKLQYTFEKLSIEKANKLFLKLGKEVVVDKPVTLAEIYNTDNVVVTPMIPTKKIGF